MKKMLKITNAQGKCRSKPGQLCLMDSLIAQFKVKNLPFNAGAELIHGSGRSVGEDGTTPSLLGFPGTTIVGEKSCKVLGDLSWRF